MLLCGNPSANDLLSKAMQLKYTNNGEMFSAQWLLQLFKDNLPVGRLKMPDKIRSYIYDGELNSEFIKEKLKRHSMLLVPYDADVRNHTPSNQNGHRAHWSLICGYLIDNHENVSGSRFKRMNRKFSF
jgi:hypothetical protein